MQTSSGTESDRNPASAPAAAAPGGPRSSSGATVAQRALWLIVILAIAAGGYAWVDQRRAAQSLQVEIARRLADADAALAQARAREADIAGQLREAQSQLASLETRVNESQAQQASLDALYRDLAPSRDELALTEIEQILVLASQQLGLAGNVQAALNALQVADSKIAQLDRPQFGPLRRALAHDIDQLKAVPYVDVAGISIRIDQVVASIDTLPLARDERIPPSPPPASPADESAWHRFLRELWAQIGDVIRIEVTNRPAAPLVTPEQSFFLRENLRLHLLSARIALLSRDDLSFKADLQAATAWLRKYFDPTAKPVQAAIAMLTEQAAVTMPGEIPDLSRSLEAVRVLKAAGERVEGRAPARASGRAR
ncbi:MAG TPA: uroporphyrinogen-III C-methyltransferase [Casimicrobiaceae bacterium]|nr:uroporphyrinogen-III C-methyltransferase [Casimicrobiaceae bacterium]